MLKNWLLILFWVCSFSLTSEGAPVVVLTSDQDQYNLSADELGIFEDTDHDYSIQAVKANAFQDKFVPLSKSNAAAGYTSSALWFKLQVFDKSKKTARWLLSIGHPPLDHVDVYLPDSNNNYIRYQTGDALSFDTREIDHRKFVFPLPDWKEQKTIYIRIASTSAIFIDFKIWKEEAFLSHERNTQLGYGIYFGIIIIMFFYNFILWLALRDTNYLYYVLFILGIGTVQLVLTGLAFEYLWPNAPVWNNIANPFFVAFPIFWGLLFSRQFLNVKEYVPLLNKVIWGIAIFSLFLMAACFVLNYRTTSRLGDVLNLVAIVTVVTAGIITKWRGYKPARFFLIAWIGLFIGAALLSFESFGWIDRNLITQFSVYGGLIWLIILLSIAMADRINLMRKEKIEAQQEVIQQLEEKHALKNKVNRELEDKVKQRTKEIQQQKNIIEQKNKDLTDSINYAKKIQEAILPAYKIVLELLPQSFIFYKPRDIVSGDFYWLERKKGKILLAAVDCTGHGVPGAFMSMVGNQILNKLVVEGTLQDPGRILQELDENVKQALRQDSETTDTQDGMDIALCSIDKKKKEIQFAGAHRPLYIVRNGELKEWKGTPAAIGGSLEETQKFKTRKIKVKKGDTLYMFSDGYADQFGGHAPEIRNHGGKKFMRSRFKKLLASMADKPMSEQKQKLAEQLEEWQGDLEQVDDILVIGVRI